MLSWRCRRSRLPPGCWPGCQVRVTAACTICCLTYLAEGASRCSGQAVAAPDVYTTTFDRHHWMEWCCLHAGAAARKPPAGPRTVASRPAQVLAAALLLLCTHLATRQLRRLSVSCATLPGMLPRKHHLFTDLRRSVASLGDTADDTALATPSLPPCDRGDAWWIGWAGELCRGAAAVAQSPAATHTVLASFALVILLQAALAFVLSLLPPIATVCSPECPIY